MADMVRDTDGRPVVDVVVGPDHGRRHPRLRGRASAGRAGHLRGGGARRGRGDPPGVPARLRHRARGAGVPGRRHPDHGRLAGRDAARHRVDRRRAGPGIGHRRPLRWAPRDRVAGIGSQLPGAIRCGCSTCRPTRPDRRPVPPAPRACRSSPRDPRAPSPPEAARDAPPDCQASPRALVTPGARVRRLTRATASSGCPDLVRARDALDLGRDVAGGVDQEHVRLGRQPVVERPPGPAGAGPSASSSGWSPLAVCCSWYGSTWTKFDAVLVVRRDALDDVQRRAAHGRLAEGRRREDDERRLPGRDRLGDAQPVEVRDRAACPWRWPRCPRASSRSGVSDAGAGAPMAGVAAVRQDREHRPGRSTAPAGRPAVDLEAPVARAGERDGHVVEAAAVADVEERAHRRSRPGWPGPGRGRRSGPGWARSPTTAAGSGGRRARTRTGSAGRRRSGCSR